MKKGQIQRLFRRYPMIATVPVEHRAEVMRRAQSRGASRVGVSVIVLIATNVVLLPIVIGLTLLFADIVGTALAPLGRGATLAGVIFVAGCALAATVGVIWSIENWMLTRSVRRELEIVLLRQGCTACGYSLHGLPAIEGLVTCPECSHRNNLVFRAYGPDQPS